MLKNKKISILDAPTEWPVKKFIYGEFVSDLNEYLTQKKEKYNETLFKSFSHYEEKKAYIDELKELLEEYKKIILLKCIPSYVQVLGFFDEVRPNMGNVDLKLKMIKQKVISKLNEGSYRFWTGKNPSNLSFLLAKWRFRLEYSDIKEILDTYQYNNYENLSADDEGFETPTLKTTLN